jgi:hypothetical protein
MELGYRGLRVCVNVMVDEAHTLESISGVERASIENVKT